MLRPLPAGMRGDAVFSSEVPALYRHVLKRSWKHSGSGNGGRVLFIGHNPSKAGKLYDDPTIAKVCKFTLAWGYNELLMHNLMDRIATDPNELRGLRGYQLFTPRNNLRILQAARSSNLIVCCWGKVDPAFRLVMESTVSMLRAQDITLHCIDVNDDGSPKHPLYIANGTKVKLWNMEVN